MNRWIAPGVIALFLVFCFAPYVYGGHIAVRGENKDILLKEYEYDVLNFKLYIDGSKPVRLWVNGSFYLKVKITHFLNASWAAVYKVDPKAILIWDRGIPHNISLVERLTGDEKFFTLTYNITRRVYHSGDVGWITGIHIPLSSNDHIKVGNASMTLVLLIYDLTFNYTDKNTDWVHIDFKVKVGKPPEPPTVLIVAGLLIVGVIVAAIAVYAYERRKMR